MPLAAGDIVGGLRDAAAAHRTWCRRRRRSAYSSIRPTVKAPEQTERDRYECHVWAVQQTGVDPSRANAGL